MSTFLVVLRTLTLHKMHTSRTSLNNFTNIQRSRLLMVRQRTRLQRHYRRTFDFLTSHAFQRTETNQFTRYRRATHPCTIAKLGSLVTGRLTTFRTKRFLSTLSFRALTFGLPSRSLHVQDLQQILKEHRHRIQRQLSAPRLRIMYRSTNRRDNSRRRHNRHGTSSRLTVQKDNAHDPITFQLEDFQHQQGKLQYDQDHKLHCKRHTATQRQRQQGHIYQLQDRLFYETFLILYHELFLKLLHELQYRLQYENFHRHKVSKGVVQGPYLSNVELRQGKSRQVTTIHTRLQLQDILQATLHARRNFSPTSISSLGSVVKDQHNGPGSCQGELAPQQTVR